MKLKRLLKYLQEHCIDVDNACENCLFNNVTYETKQGRKMKLCCFADCPAAWEYKNIKKAVKKLDKQKKR